MHTRHTLNELEDIGGEIVEILRAKQLDLGEQVVIIHCVEDFIRLRIYKGIK